MISPTFHVRDKKDQFGTYPEEPTDKNGASPKGSPRVRPHWWYAKSKSGGVTEFLVNCLPCDGQGTFKRTDATT